MFVVVALTIWAPVNDSTTWTLVPLTLSPELGFTIATTAGELGRLPEATGAEGSAPVVGAAGGEPHPATISARSAARTTNGWKNLVIGALVSFAGSSRCAGPRRCRDGTGAYIEIEDRLIASRLHEPA